MVSGVLACKTKKRAAEAALFLCPTLSMLDIGWSTLRTPGFTPFSRFSFGRFSWWASNDLR
jgi:hypothetical protein